MKMKITPLHEPIKRKFPSYIINSQFIPPKIQLTNKPNQMGKTIIFSNNPQLLRKMKKMKKKTMGMWSLPNKINEIHHQKQSTDYEEHEMKHRQTHKCIDINNMWNMEKNNEEKENNDLSKNAIGNKDFKSKKMNEYMMKRNLYLPKINQLLKSLPPRYDRQIMKNKTNENMTTGRNNYNNCMLAEFKL